MNPRTLAGHCEKLTPMERFPLITAAALRGDKAERRHLMHSAPRTIYELSQHGGAAKAFKQLANFHFMKLLDLAAQ